MPVDNSSRALLPEFLGRGTPAVGQPTQCVDSAAHLGESREWRECNAQQESFRLLVESVTDYAIYMLDTAGRVITWNAGAERSKGYKAEEILGREYAVFFTAEDVAAGEPARELETAAREGRFEIQAWRVRKDGSKFWALVTLTAMRDAAGKLLGYAKVTRDMTAQKAAADALRERNALLEHYRTLFESINDYMIFTLNAEGRVDSWGPGAELLSGYSATEAVGREYASFFPPEAVLAGEPRRELEEAARSGRCVTETWRVGRAGKMVWASGVLSAIRDSRGRLTGYVRVARDMTRQKQAEEALRQLNGELERYRIIVENVDEYLIYSLDARGRIESWNPSLEKLTGYAAREVIGREYGFSFPPEAALAGEPRRQMEEAVSRGYCTMEGWRLKRDGSTFWSSGVLSAVRDPSGALKGYVRVARDMTQQKMMGDAQERMAAELERRVVERTRELELTVADLRRKSQEVEAFVYIVSHDLRAPLVNVQGFACELDESCRRLKSLLDLAALPEPIRQGARAILDEEVAGALHYISTSTTKFERLIDALLNLSRHGRQVYQMARLNVAELVAGTVASFAAEIAVTGAVVEVGDLPPVLADRTAIEQVFANLIGNSIKYRSPERPLKIEVGGQVEDTKTHYWVRDNGLGIPEYAKARLFQVFQRLHAQQAEGEGMGLAIAHRIIERHAGRIWAESREGEGSTFHLTLAGLPSASSAEGAPCSASD